MPQKVIEFYPPMRGMDGEFNTFRAGIAWYARIEVGDVLLMIDSRKKVVMGTAEVTDRFKGPLGDMAELYADGNHNQLDDPDKAGAGARLIAAMKRRYGPHIISENKNVTVIYLRRKT